MTAIAERDYLGRHIDLLGQVQQVPLGATTLSVPVLSTIFVANNSQWPGRVAFVGWVTITRADGLTTPLPLGTIVTVGSNLATSGAIASSLVWASLVDLSAFVSTPITLFAGANLGLAALPGSVSTGQPFQICQPAGFGPGTPTLCTVAAFGWVD